MMKKVTETTLEFSDKDPSHKISGVTNYTKFIKNNKNYKNKPTSGLIYWKSSKTLNLVDWIKKSEKFKRQFQKPWVQKSQHLDVNVYSSLFGSSKKTNKFQSRIKNIRKLVQKEKWKPKSNSRK